MVSPGGVWSAGYGFGKDTIGKDDNDPVEERAIEPWDGVPQGDGERPGLDLAALFHLIGHSVFLRLSDVASGLPAYEEQVLLSGMLLAT